MPPTPATSRDIIHDGLGAFDTVIPCDFPPRPDVGRGRERARQSISSISKIFTFTATAEFLFRETSGAVMFETFDDYVALFTGTSSKTVGNRTARRLIARRSIRRSRRSRPVTIPPPSRPWPAAPVQQGRHLHPRPRQRTIAGGVRFRQADCRRLGYHLKEFDREAYRNTNSFPEAEFLATGMSGEDVNMLALETDLRRTVFFTGFHGIASGTCSAIPMSCSVART